MRRQRDHDHRTAECDCGGIHVKLHKMYVCKDQNSSVEKYSRYFFDDEEAYNIRPQDIEVTSPNSVAVLSQMDCCYELVCLKCHCSFKVITTRKTAIIQQVSSFSRAAQHIPANVCTLANTFPFQLRPFIRITNVSHSLPLFEEDESSTEEEKYEDPYYPSIVDDIQPLLPIVGDIPSGFLVL